MVYSPSPFTNLSLTTSVNPSSFHYLHGHLASSSMKTPFEVSRAKKLLWILSNSMRMTNWVYRRDWSVMCPVRKITTKSLSSRRHMSTATIRMHFYNTFFQSWFHEPWGWSSRFPSRAENCSRFSEKGAIRRYSEALVWLCRQPAHILLHQQVNVLQSTHPQMTFLPFLSLFRSVTI